MFFSDFSLAETNPCQLYLKRTPAQINSTINKFTTAEQITITGVVTAFWK
jgi:hypothetical protein